MSDWALCPYLKSGYAQGKHKMLRFYKGRTIIFLTGGGTIFQRLGHNFFLNFSLSKQFFSEILVRQTIYFFNLLKSNNFFFFHGLFSYLWN